MADEPSDKDKERRPLQQAVRDAWMSALGVFSSAETEVQRATERLVQALGLGEGAVGIVAELKARMRKNREEFDRKVDEGVRAAIQRVRAPIDKELQQLRTRLEALQAKIERRKGEPKDPDR